MLTVDIIYIWLTSYPVSVKNKCQLICAKLDIWLTSRSGPAHSHVSSCHSLKFKVPFPSLHCIRPLYSEETDLVYAEPLNHLSYLVEIILNKIRNKIN